MAGKPKKADDAAHSNAFCEFALAVSGDPVIRAVFACFARETGPANEAAFLTTLEVVRRKVAAASDEDKELILKCLSHDCCSARRRKSSADCWRAAKS